jgi:diacylglycerol kinase family enzyme
VRTLASEVELKVVETRYRGHAASFAAGAAADGYRLVLTLGGDGTFNEAVNGLVGGAAARGRTAGAGVPAVAPIPGGGANVFARSLGYPADPIAATNRILGALRAGRERSIGLGLAEGRYFTFNAGVGWDAEVVREVEGLRARGRRESPPLYLWRAFRQFYGGTDRRHAALTLERNAAPPVEHIFMAIISNTAPWTYLGNRPVNPTPQARFDSGLDVFALRELHTFSTLNALRQMLDSKDRPPDGRHVVSLHDEPALTLRSRRPIAFQVDGEYVGEVECVTFTSVPDALRVIA